MEQVLAAATKEFQAIVNNAIGVTPKVQVCVCRCNLIWFGGSTISYILPCATICTCKAHKGELSFHNLFNFSYHPLFIRLFTITTASISTISNNCSKLSYPNNPNEPNNLKTLITLDILVDLITTCHYLH